MRKFLKYFAASLSIFFILCTMLPFIPTGAGFIRMLEFPRLQLLTIGILAVISGSIFYVFYNKKEVSPTVFYIVLSFLGFSIFYQIYMIFPYTPLYQLEAENFTSNDGKKHLKILISNVLTENRETSGLFGIVKQKNPDVIILTEPDKWWIEKTSVEFKNYTYKVEYPLDNLYGIALYSKLELIEPKVNFLVKPDIPSIYTKLKLPDNSITNLYCVHPEPPLPHNDADERDIELLIAAKDAKKSPGSDILAGDLNDVAWSETNDEFKEISGLLDPRIGRGFFNTFNVNYPFLRYPLDHIFFSREFKYVTMESLDDIGSDHFPLYIELSYEP